ncbi:MAG TPA: AAC(3) family N-acetyltransferase [Anaerolineae bacterium]|jgi:aminoglycoside 3-N-acetyltransferase|nr:AAC(3) family N-acetyltransferase [Anaerolineae bacterium]
MSEAKTIENAPTPRTRDSLAADLRALGLWAGHTVIVHSSLSALGWVCGGPVAVIQALMDVITPDGTLIMPAHSGELSEPAEWQHPPVPTEWWSIIRETMPAFDLRVTPTRGMGRIAESFRTWPNVRRSDHPQVSFAAWGHHAGFITTNHSLDFSMGEQSPLARIYELDGSVLLLGVPYANNTSFHLGEYRAPGAKLIAQGAPLVENGRRVWQQLHDIENDSAVFDELGAAFEAVLTVARGNVGSAECRLFSQRTAVDFAARWIRDRRVM